MLTHQDVGKEFTTFIRDLGSLCNVGLVVAGTGWVVMFVVILIGAHYNEPMIDGRLTVYLTSLTAAITVVSSVGKILAKAVAYYRVQQRLADVTTLFPPQGPRPVREPTTNGTAR